MESLQLGTEQKVSLNSVQVLKCKYDGLAFAILSSIIAILLVALVVIRHPHPTGERGIDLSLEALIVACILLINPLSYFTARSISKLVTAEPANRTALTWVIHRGTSYVAFLAIVIANLLATSLR